MDVPDDASEYRLDIARCTPETPEIWPETNLCRVSVEVLTDDWVPCGAFEAYGGQHKTRTGEIAKTSWLIGKLPEQKNRKLRITSEVNSEITLVFR